MTQAEVDRMVELSDKMDRAAEAAGRTYSDTADLTAAELAEWHRLEDKAINAGISESEAAAANWGVDNLAGEEDGRIGVQSDGTF